MGRKTKQNRITSPELIARINPKNARLTEDFLDYLRSTGKAETTVRAYESDLAIFFVWALQFADNKYFPEISKRDIVAFQNWLLRENKNSPARVRRIKSTLSSLPDSVIQSIVGWSSADMLRIYVDIDQEEEIGKYFSDGKIIGRKAAEIADL